MSATTPKQGINAGNETAVNTVVNVSLTAVLLPPLKKLPLKPSFNDGNETAAKALSLPPFMTAVFAGRAPV